MISTRLIALLALAASLPFSESKYPWTIIDPNARSVWYAKSDQTITWDVGTFPSRSTNPKGDIYLARNKKIFEHHLASGFNLTAGKVMIKVPDHIIDGTYQVLLIGESKNLSLSSDFTILGNEG